MEKRFYTVDEIAIYLGLSVSAIRTWVRLGKIPVSKINGGIRFNVEEIDVWIKKINKRSYLYN